MVTRPEPDARGALDHTPRATFDVFVSYSRGHDGDLARATVAALEGRGVSAFLDETGIGPFRGITPEILRAIASARAFVALLSPDYLTRSACCTELGVALALDPERVLVLNTSAGDEHIAPAQLRDLRYHCLLAEEGADGPAAAADAVVARLAELPAEPLDDPQEPALATLAGWLVDPPMGAGRFEGRERELLDIFGHLHAAWFPLTTYQATRERIGVVSGVGGQGKSSLARVYADRFASAYPGGVIWLSASPPDGLADPTALRGQLLGELSKVARRFGVAEDEPTPLATQPTPPRIDEERLRDLCARVAGAVRARRRMHLWIVDGFPVGLDEAHLRGWIPYEPNVTALVTTQDARGFGLTSHLRLDGLGENAAYRLLTHSQPPDGEGEERAARRLVHRLKGHPVALGVAADDVRLPGRTRPYARFLELLDNAPEDQLETAGRLAQELGFPTAYTSVALTLLRAILDVGPGADGRSLVLGEDPSDDVLRVAGLLAEEPIPGDLMRATLAEGLRLPAEEASRRQDEGCARLVRCSLARAGTRAGEIAVHGLAVRAVRWLEGYQPRAGALRTAAVARLADELTWAESPEALAGLGPHAQALCTSVADEPTAWLARLVARERSSVGALSQTHKLQEDAHRYLAEKRGPSDQQAVAAMLELAATKRALGDASMLADALAHQEDALRILIKRMAEDFGPALRGSARRALLAANEVGLTLRRQGSYAEASRVFQRLNYEAVALLGPEHPFTLTFMDHLALTLHDQGDLIGARAFQERVVEGFRRVLGDDHADTVTSMNNLASSLQSQGNLTGARALQEQVIARLRQEVGDEDVHTLTSMDNLAVTLRRQGDLAGAQALQERVVEGFRRVLGEEDVHTLTSMNNLAVTLSRQGDLAGAQALQERVVEGFRRVHGDEHPLTLTKLSNLAAALYRQGDLAGARALEEQVFRTRRRTLGPNHPSTLESMSNLTGPLGVQEDLSGASVLEGEVSDAS